MSMKPTLFVLIANVLVKLNFQLDVLNNKCR